MERQTEEMNGCCEYAVGGEAAVTADRERFLVEAAKSDREAFCELYMKYYPRVYSFVAKRTRNVADSEDITMTTFERAMTYIARYDAKKGSFSSWLYRIAINTTRDHMRKNNGDRAVSLDGLGDALVFESDDQISAGRDFREIMRLVDRLDEKHQLVLVLRFMEGMSHRELSEVLGCSSKAVSMRITRALRAFRGIAREEGYCPYGGRK
jgi:RNA polymerase sigma-70 factor, ECF subfamily